MTGRRRVRPAGAGAEGGRPASRIGTGSAERRLRVLLRAVACAVAIGAATVAPPRSRADHLVFFDGDFPETAWEIETVEFGNGGSAAGIREDGGGQSGAWYSVQVSLAAADATPSVVYGVFLRTDAVHDPGTDEPIRAIDYDEYARLVVGTGLGQRTGPALRQGGVLYVARLEDDPLYTSERTWVRRRARALTASDFVAPGTTRHPDFSPMGSPVTFGFYRAVSGAPSQPAVAGPVAGIDGWRVEVNPPPSLELADEVRAGASTETTPPAGDPVVASQWEFRAPRHLADAADASAAVPPDVGTARSRARASIEGGVGSRSEAEAPADAGTPADLATTGRASRLRTFVAEGNPGTAAVELVIACAARGGLDLRGPDGGGPPAATPDTLRASARFEVRVHRVQGTSDVLAAEAVLDFDGSTGAPRLVVSGPDAFAASLAFPQSEPSPLAAMDWSESLGAVATLESGESFAVEVALTTDARSPASAAGWRGTADVGSFDVAVSTATPGGRVVERFAEPLATTAGIPLRGSQRVRWSGKGWNDRDAGWTVCLAQPAWLGESDGGATIRGIVLAARRGGRALLLGLDPSSAEELLTDVADQARAAGWGDADLSLRSRALPVARLRFDDSGTNARLRADLRVRARLPGRSRSGTVRIRLEGVRPPAKDGR